MMKIRNISIALFSVFARCPAESTRLSIDAEMKDKMNLLEECINADNQRRGDLTPEERLERLKCAERQLLEVLREKMPVKEDATPDAKTLSQIEDAIREHIAQSGEQVIKRDQSSYDLMKEKHPESHIICLQRDIDGVMKAGMMICIPASVDVSQTDLASWITENPEKILSLQSRKGGASHYIPKEKATSKKLREAFQLFLKD